MSLPVFDLSDLSQNLAGWGPQTPPTGVDTSSPFQQFNKADRIGRVADWIGVDRFFRSRGVDRYNERMYGSAANAGSQFDYVHGMDENNFQLVDSSKPIQRSTQRNFRSRQLQFRKLLQKEQERREQANQGQNVKVKRSIAKEQQRAYKMWQRRGGNARQGQRPMGGGGRYGGDRPKDRQASVQVRTDWKVIEELDAPRLLKLSLPNVTAEDIGDHQYGVLHYYDKAIDRISVKNPQILSRCSAQFYNLSTTDDPVIEQLAQEGVGNVYATDMILATLMTASRSIYSWDLVAHRIGDKIFFDKRDNSISNPVDALTVSETSGDPPAWEGSGLNNAKDLATEALYINQNFRRQAVRRNDEGLSLKNKRAPFEEEGGESGTGYKYRKFTLGNGVNGKPVEVVCRTEHDGVMIVGTEPHMMSIKAINEWDSGLSNGVDWRTKLDAQKGAVLAAEIKNNSCKLAKWTVQAVLAESDILKLGFVSRMNVRNSAQHQILGTTYVNPKQFAGNISLNMDNAWGVLRCVIDSLMKQPNGKYLLLKDPQAPVVRIYALPEGTFDSEEDSEEENNSDSDEE